MQNHFSIIGEMICQLETGEGINDLRAEENLNRAFGLMNRYLLENSVHHSTAVTYCLEFHREECARLLRKVNAMYRLFANYPALRKGKENLNNLYPLLIDHLSIQSLRLEHMLMDLANLAIQNETTD